MSRTPSPASDAASPLERSDTSPNSRDDAVSVQDASARHCQGSGSAHGSQSPNDTSASRSTSESLSTSAPAPPPETSAASASASASHATSSNSWQAVWSTAHNAYYFYNSVTQETTWVNPLQSNAEAGPSNAHGASASSDACHTPAASSSSYDIYAAAAAQGIDPALAHLDPSLATSDTTPGAFTYTAKFNARTGAFTRPDGRDPTHLSEYERAKRMSEFYFDVNAWENEVEKRKLEEAHEEESRKRKKPTKKDLERFKEQKRQKKLAKTAWLRT